MYSNLIASFYSVHCTLTDISYHRSLFLTLKSLSETNSTTTAQSTKPKMVIKYDYSKEILNHLNALLSRKLSNNAHINTFSEFINLFSTSIDVTCKLIVSKFSKRNRITNPWITIALINSISKRDRLFKSWKKTTTKICKSGDPRLQEEYRKYRNKLSSLIKCAKEQYYMRMFKNSTGNLKQTWSIINELRGKSKGSTSTFSAFKSAELTDKKSLANKFNNYFCNLAATLNEGIPNRNGRSLEFTKFFQKSEQSLIFLNDAEEDEILEIIKEFSNDKSSDFPIVVNKHCAKITASTLCRFYNMHMLTGTFTDELKLGIITTVYKKGKKDEIENYRPISTLPIFGKIF